MPPLPYPALHASHGGVWIATAEETRAVGRGEAIRIAADAPVVLLNAPLIGQRPPDILEAADNTTPPA